MAFSYYKKISFNGSLIGGTFDNFCLFLDFTDTQIRDACRSDAYDIKFYSTSSQTGELPYYRTYWDSSAGRWVGRVLLTLSASTEIFLFYGDASITSSQSNKRATFDPAGIVYYFTFDDDPGAPNSTARDNARLTNHAGGENTANQLTIGGNDDISLVNSNKVGPNIWDIVYPPQVQVEDKKSLANVPNWTGGAWGTGPLWIHAWTNHPPSINTPSQAAGNNSFIVIGNRGGNPWFKLKIDRPWRFQLQSPGSSEGGVGSFHIAHPFDIIADTWYCYDYRFDRPTNTMQVYLDSQPGEAVSYSIFDGVDFTPNPNSDGEEHSSVLCHAGYGSSFIGRIAEMVISHFSPSDERIETSYNNELSHSSFRTFGTQENAGGPPPPPPTGELAPLINGGLIDSGLIKA